MQLYSHTSSHRQHGLFAFEGNNGITGIVIDSDVKRQWITIQGAAYLLKMSSIVLVSTSGASLFVVVNPIQRPKKITEIHSSREKIPASLPASGAALSFSHRCAFRPAVSSKISMLIPESASASIFRRNIGLWK